jgi:hypothetical protein
VWVATLATGAFVATCPAQNHVGEPVRSGFRQVQFQEAVGYLPASALTEPAATAFLPGEAASAPPEHSQGDAVRLCKVGNIVDNTVGRKAKPLAAATSPIKTHVSMPGGTAVLVCSASEEEYLVHQHGHGLVWVPRASVQVFEALRRLDTGVRAGQIEPQLAYKAELVRPARALLEVSGAQYLVAELPAHAQVTALVFRLNHALVLLEEPHRGAAGWVPASALRLLEPTPTFTSASAAPLPPVEQVEVHSAGKAGVPIYTSPERLHEHVRAKAGAQLAITRSTAAGAEVALPGGVVGHVARRDIIGGQPWTPEAIEFMAVVEDAPIVEPQGGPSGEAPLARVSLGGFGQASGGDLVAGARIDAGLALDSAQHWRFAVALDGTSNGREARMAVRPTLEWMPLGWGNDAVLLGVSASPGVTLLGSEAFELRAGPRLELHLPGRRSALALTYEAGLRAPFSGEPRAELAHSGGLAFLHRFGSP